MRMESPNGEHLGVIDVGFTVTDLSRELEQIKISPNGRVVIMDSAGMLVAANEIRETDAGTSGILAIDSADFEISSAVKALAGPTVSMTNMDSITPHSPVTTVRSIRSTPNI